MVMTRGYGRGSWPRSVRGAAALGALLSLAACSDNLAPVPDEPAEFISQKRAWLPGERDSTIARWQRDSVLFVPHAGNLSEYADQILDPDSVVEVVANPDFSALAADPSFGLLVLAPRFATSWNIIGMKIVTINIEPTPDDTLSLLGVFWSNPAEPTWIGFMFAAVPAGATSLAQTHPNSVTFDTTFAKVGVGGGELRQSDTTFWYAAGGTLSGSNNTLSISSSSFGTPSTVTTGPYLGGTMATGTMTGRMRTISMPRQFGSTAPATASVDFNFNGTAITATSFRCVFNSPCTTNVP